MVDKVAERIKSTPLGSDAESAAYVRGQYETMLPLQRQLLWQRLLKCVPLAHDNLLVLNNMLAVSTSKNAEIRFLLVSYFYPCSHVKLDDVPTCNE